MLAGHHVVARPPRQLPTSLAHLGTMLLTLPSLQLGMIAAAAPVSML